MAITARGMNLTNPRLAKLTDLLTITSRFSTGVWGKGRGGGCRGCISYAQAQPTKRDEC